MSTHDAVLADLRSEPLARGTLLTLAGAALAALGLALVGLLLVVVSDLRDERGELFDLEAQGAAPATLRQHLRLRTALVAAFGLVGGIATGAVLAALVVALVTLTAGAGSAELPLLLGFGWPALLLGLLAYFLVAAMLVLYYTHATVNTMVLAGLVIAVGVVVDDAIIDIENIVRRLREHRRAGGTRPTAAIVLEASVASSAYTRPTRAMPPPCKGCR